MPVTFNNEPVIDLIRGLIDQELTEDGDTPVVIPDDYVLKLYRFDSKNCPMTVICVREQVDEARKPAIFDLTHWIRMTIYHVRVRLATDGITEDVAAQRMDSFAAFFSTNPRLAVGGVANVQRCEICKRATGETAAAGADFIPIEQMAGLAVASMELQVCWIENLITS